MTYVQLSLLHVPATVVHGNALSMEVWGTWYTPAHILGGWTFKLRRRLEADLLREAVALEHSRSLMWLNRPMSWRKSQSRQRSKLRTWRCWNA